jgi:hypothetical protein
LSAKDDSDLRTFELSTRERDLLLKYGYPFPEAEAALRQSQAVEGMHTVRIRVYWIERLLGDLAYSINRTRSRTLTEELDEIYSVLETAAQFRDDERWD